MESFAAVQARLGEALRANQPGSGVDHVLIALPSYSVGESLLSHYVERIPALEHRYLVSVLMLGRIPDCHLVYLGSRAPDPEVVEHYLAAMDPDLAARARDRIHFVTVDDSSARSVAAKLLEHPDVLEWIREFVAGRPALIEPWNVTTAEVQVALQLGVPINGTDPALWPLAFKSSGRKLMRAAGVAVPEGVEDVKNVDEVVEAMLALRERVPGATRCVLKHDDSGGGDGNVVLDLALDPRAMRNAVSELPEWYLADLAHGGVVEEFVEGRNFTSPSAQVDIRPDGAVHVLATHEQILDGDNGQVYSGCRFPAEPRYAAELARDAAAVGAALATEGACGRLAIDFVCVQGDDGTTRVNALEINLRKGGTSHPYAVLRSLVPGHYDAQRGQWQADADGAARAYFATDNIVDPARIGCPPSTVLRAVTDAGLQFDRTTRCGVVLHMLSCLAIDGRFGLTAIGENPEHAHDMYERTVAATANLGTRG